MNVDEFRFFVRRIYLEKHVKLDKGNGLAVVNPKLFDIRPGDSYVSLYGCTEKWTVDVLDAHRKSYSLRRDEPLKGHPGAVDFPSSTFAKCEFTKPDCKELPADEDPYGHIHVGHTFLPESLRERFAKIVGDCIDNGLATYLPVLLNTQGCAADGSQL